MTILYLNISEKASNQSSHNFKIETVFFFSCQNIAGYFTPPRFCPYSLVPDLRQSLVTCEYNLIICYLGVVDRFHLLSNLISIGIAQKQATMLSCANQNLDHYDVIF